MAWAEGEKLVEFKWYVVSLRDLASFIGAVTSVSAFRTCLERSKIQVSRAGVQLSMTENNWKMCNKTEVQERSVTEMLKSVLRKQDDLEHFLAKNSNVRSRLQSVAESGMNSTVFA